VAASYQPERYLIGPRLYPAFLKTCRIVLPILGALALVGVGISLGRTPLEAGAGIDTVVARTVETIVQAAAEFFGTLVSALGVIVLIYAILERTMPDLKEKPASWNPRDLLKVKPADSVALGEPISSLVFTLVALVIFNFYPDLIAVTWRAGEGFVSMPVLSEAFWGYLPVLNLLWLAQIGLHLGLIYQGRWSAWTRWLSLGVTGLEIGVAAAMLQGPGLIGLTADQLAAQGGMASQSAEVLVTLLNQGVRVTLVIIIVFGIVNVVKGVLRLLKDRSAPVLVSR
jgi:hypothetical protein